MVEKAKGKFILEYGRAREIIDEVKKELMAKNEASDLFGQENSDKLKGLLGNIYQTFDKKDLYLSLEEKTAHFLYFIIKDHPFIDGNGRTARLLMAKLPNFLLSAA